MDARAGTAEESEVLGVHVWRAGVGGRRVLVVVGVAVHRAVHPGHVRADARRLWVRGPEVDGVCHVFVGQLCDFLIQLLRQAAAGHCQVRAVRVAAVLPGDHGDGAGAVGGPLPVGALCVCAV